jgi:kinesin family protein 2/24
MGNTVGREPERPKTRTKRTRPETSVKRLEQKPKGLKRPEKRRKTTPASGRSRTERADSEPHTTKGASMKTTNKMSNSELRNTIADFRESVDFRPLRQSDPIKEDRMLVCVRKRPLNNRELARDAVDIVSVPRKDEIVVHEVKTKYDLSAHVKNQHFKFDYVFDETSNNNFVYNFAAKPLVKNVLRGGIATCFAYGETGSGKTHTMAGTKAKDSKNAIYTMTAEDIFRGVRSSKYKKFDLNVSVSFYEIYNGDVFDLLANKTKLHFIEDRKLQVEVVGLTEKQVHSFKGLLQLLEQGNRVRASRRTWAKYSSSRAHAMFDIILRKNGAQGIYGKFSMVDLAGSERRVGKEYSKRQKRFEGSEINTSLLCLRECIQAFSMDSKHVPFRNSKLTHILRDSFIGQNSKICIIGMISPGMFSCACTLDTLRSLNRIKELESIFEEEM